MNQTLLLSACSNVGDDEQYVFAGAYLELRIRSLTTQICIYLCALRQNSRAEKHGADLNYEETKIISLLSGFYKVVCMC